METTVGRAHLRPEGTRKNCLRTHPLHGTSFLLRRTGDKPKRIFVWHHADGAPPTYDVIGYRPDESDWTPWRSNSYRVRVHVQDLTENIIDRSHFAAVHDMAPPERNQFDVRFNGISMVVEQNLKVTAVDIAGYEIQTTSTTCGPGIVAVEVSQDPIEMLTYVTQTPIDEELTEVNLSFSMKQLPDEHVTESISALNDRITNEQFAQDVPIWENKIYRDRPMVTKMDGPGSAVPPVVPAVLRRQWLTHYRYRMIGKFLLGLGRGCRVSTDAQVRSGGFANDQG